MNTHIRIGAVLFERLLRKKLDAEPLLPGTGEPSFCILDPIQMKNVAAMEEKVESLASYLQAHDRPPVSALRVECCKADNGRLFYKLLFTRADA